MIDRSKTVDATTNRTTRSPKASVSCVASADGSHDLARQLLMLCGLLNPTGNGLGSTDCSNPTQDSLSVAGQAVPDGLLTRKTPMNGFKVLQDISSHSLRA